MSETAVAEPENAELLALIDEHFREFKEGSIVNGTILDIRPQVVVVDIGYKSEGAIPVSEFEDEDIEVGDEVEVLLERLEDDEGLIVLSKEKAAHKQLGEDHESLRGWWPRERKSEGCRQRWPDCERGRGSFPSWLASGYYSSSRPSGICW